MTVEHARDVMKAYRCCILSPRHCDGCPFHIYLDEDYSDLKVESCNELFFKHSRGKCVTEAKKAIREVQH